MRRSPHISPVSSRREFLSRGGSGVGAIALAHLLSQSGFGAASTRNPLAPKSPHHPPKAKSVIWLFMEGGPSHIDLFDPKPLVQKLAGQPMPASFERPKTANGTENNALLPTKRVWKQHGQSGMWISDWYPHIAQHADDLAVIRSCWADGINHLGAVSQMNTGSILNGRPSLGAWTLYGLGSANENLPAFVILIDDQSVTGGPANWSAGFLPATYQGTQFLKEGPPILFLKPPATIDARQQRAKLDLLRSLNQHDAETHPGEDELEARLQSFELAYRMQSTAPDAVDLAKESDATRRLYGIDDPVTAKFGSNCLLARRLVERGVRFVELYCGSGNGWDAHKDIEGNHSHWCRVSDKPIAGLLADLKARGLLESTLVVWGGEFGRTPFYEKRATYEKDPVGRDHNPWGFTIWMAGGGARSGTVAGATDEIGLRAIEKPYHVHDIHATVLHLLGLNHLNLTYLHTGRAERPTVTGGQLITEVVG
jgi:hypothetical protein